MKQAGDVGRAEESASRGREADPGPRRRAPGELAASAAAIDPATEKLETLTLRPKKSDITVRKVVLLWRPYRGGAPAFG